MIIQQNRILLIMNCNLCQSQQPLLQVYFQQSYLLCHNENTLKELNQFNKNQNSHIRNIIKNSYKCEQFDISQFLEHLQQKSNQQNALPIFKLLCQDCHEKSNFYPPFQRKQLYDMKQIISISEKFIDYDSLNKFDHQIEQVYSLFKRNIDNFLDIGNLKNLDGVEKEKKEFQGFIQSLNQQLKNIVNKEIENYQLSFIQKCKEQLKVSLQIEQKFQFAKEKVLKEVELLLKENLMREEQVAQVFDLNIEGLKIQQRQEIVLDAETFYKQLIDQDD